MSDPLDFSAGHFKEVLHALHNDQSRLVEALQGIAKIIEGYEWIAESRGCYEWNDDEYMEEIGRCFDTLRSVIDPALENSRHVHRICCGTYRNFNELTKVPVQYGLQFGETYDQFSDRIINLLAMSGVSPDGVS